MFSAIFFYMANKKTLSLSKLPIGKLKNKIKYQKQKVNKLNKSLSQIDQEKNPLKKDIRQQFEKIISENKKIEKLENQLYKSKIKNQIKSQQQKINRNKGKNKFKVQEANYKIEILKEKINNPDFQEPEILEFPYGNYFSYSSAFYYYNETKKKLLEMKKNKEITKKGHCPKCGVKLFTFQGCHICEMLKQVLEAIEASK